ncbi:YgdI/YgdR family lipoprotein [Pseudomonas sp. DTU_2021_1001937_2_SI_NGA_ILE_001]|uniref:YgdI/YgdR family lipoprotein n=1 Tax=Pseudomonas sp. DTU_2021_1001937_2_SI_NGA_ILE_001 TaxID=3077589 RepID=UPI0028FC2C30|nr:YgdI/YgdR family lipoprotein [Pseudomonas sp. DTU_2021_1001937_2_SI_NGA_ILE_001]WNW10639.1 YgdI/YgdR family lipoprotein [Pseudomonas sp. DTU_2021_1001937_2_SI_NGA_ILE_001]
MNIRTRTLLTLVLPALMLAGCSTPSVVTLQDGTQYISKDTPKTRTADGFYEFTDISGKRVRLPAADVATVRPAD